MPQTSDNLRPVERLGEIATIGGSGRSRATRKPVEPEKVQQTMAERSSVSAICRVAAAMASAPVASGAAGGAGDLLLDARHLFQRHFHAKIATRDHQRVGQGQNVVEMLHRLRLL